MFRFVLFLCLKTYDPESLANVSFPIGSMYVIFTYIWLIFMVDVSTYTIHGSGFEQETNEFLQNFKGRKALPFRTLHFPGHHQRH